MSSHSTLLTILAPLVALAALVGIAYLRTQRQPRRWLGPRADEWEWLRAALLPVLDRLLRAETDWGYAAYELEQAERAGYIDAPPEAVEELLYQRGFRRLPLAAYKSLPDGREEVGSWGYRESLLAREQVHVMLFSAPGGGTHVYAHREPSAINPLTAIDHYRGRGYDPAAGVAFVRERLGDEIHSSGR